MSYRPEFAMAYGSGVVKQEGYDKTDRPMLDFIFGLRDPRDWHAINLGLHPKDYSTFMKALGPTAITWLQNLGPGVYYNPFVEFGDEQIKYGTISLSRLKEDLEEWQTLYVAGRLHKPAIIITSPPQIHAAQAKNLEHALNASALLLPQRFSKKQLFLCAAGLSYLGDSRMRFAENPTKVANIVERNMPGFESWYSQAIANAGWLSSLGDDQFIQDITSRTTEQRFQALPLSVRLRVPIETQLDDLKQIAPALATAIGEIVHDSSIQQTLKGILTAGTIKSAHYAAAKFRKSRKRN